MSDQKFVKFAFWMLMTVFVANAKAAPEDFSATQVKNIQQVVHDYLLSNPQLLVDSLNSYQQQQIASMEQESKKLVNTYAKELFDDTGKPVVGDPKSNTVLAMFFDYQCPHCKEMGPVVDRLIKANPNLKVIFLEWPIGGENSVYAARAAVASVAQNKYYSFHQALTEKGAPLSKDDVTQIAKSIGLDMQKLDDAMKNKDIDKQLAKNFALAQKLKLIGTPTFIIGNTKTEKYGYLAGMPSQETLQKEIDNVK